RHHLTEEGPNQTRLDQPHRIRVGVAHGPVTRRTRSTPQQAGSEEEGWCIFTAGEDELARPVFQPGAQAAGQSGVETWPPLGALPQERQDLVTRGRRPIAEPAVAG